MATAAEIFKNQHRNVAYRTTLLLALYVGTNQADELPASNYLRNRLSFQEQSAH